MTRKGYFRDIMDIKILILYVAARLDEPVDQQTLYELCYVDTALSYFDFSTAVPDLVRTGHLQCDEAGRYTITEKGRNNGSTTEDSLPFSVRRSAEAALEHYRQTIRRSSLISTQVISQESGECSVILCLRDGVSTLMTLELMAPNDVQAHRLERAFQKNAELVYQNVMTSLLEEAEKHDL